MKFDNIPIAMHLGRHMIPLVCVVSVTAKNGEDFGDYQCLISRAVSWAKQWPCKSKRQCLKAKMSNVNVNECLRREKNA